MSNVHWTQIVKTTSITTYFQCLVIILFLCTTMPIRNLPTPIRSMPSTTFVRCVHHLLNFQFKLENRLQSKAIVFAWQKQSIPEGKKYSLLTTEPKYRQDILYGAKNGRKLQMAAKLLLKFGQRTLHMYPGVENFDEIALSRTVKEMWAILCFCQNFENSKWPLFFERQNFFEILAEYLAGLGAENFNKISLSRTVNGI